MSIYTEILLPKCAPSQYLIQFGYLSHYLYIVVSSIGRDLDVDSSFSYSSIDTSRNKEITIFKMIDKLSLANDYLSQLSVHAILHQLKF